MVHLKVDVPALVCFVQLRCQSNDLTESQERYYKEYHHLFLCNKKKKSYQATDVHFFLLHYSYLLHQSSTYIYAHTV